MSIFNICAGAKEVRRVKIEVMQRFRDKEADLRTREPGETLEVCKERADYLTSIGFAKIVRQTKKEGDTAG